jgi:predicted transcriptional regulator of viral defense system
MEQIINIFRKHHGYAFLKELKSNSIHTDTIRQLLHEGIIEKIKPGLYKLSDMPALSNQGMIDVCLAMPKAVICLHSALAYYDLTTTVPASIMVALPRDSKPAKLQYPPVQIFYFSDMNYHAGIENTGTDYGRFKIYSREKTIIDCFRYRNKLGLDVAVEGLRNYPDSSKRNINKLVESAKTGRVFRIMKPYMKALVQQ